MSIEPATIIAFRDYWISKHGVNLGIVGNEKHCQGYHLGRDRIYGACACKPTGDCVPGKGDNDNSLRMQRDRNGLSNAASAIDLGRLDGSLFNLYKFSTWLANECLAFGENVNDVSEVIFSPDGKNVYGWSRRAAENGNNRLIAGYGDLSHLTHTHISFMRDSEFRDKVHLLKEYFDEGDEIMAGLGYSYFPSQSPLIGELEPIDDQATYRDPRQPIDNPQKLQPGKYNVVDYVLYPSDTVAWPNGTAIGCYLVNAGNPILVPDDGHIKFTKKVVSGDCADEVAAAIVNDRSKARVSTKVVYDD